MEAPNEVYVNGKDELMWKNRRSDYVYAEKHGYMPGALENFFTAFAFQPPLSPWIDPYGVTWEKREQHGLYFPVKFPEGMPE